MKWHDNGIVISTRPHGENGLILTALTEEHGIHAGMLRGRKSHMSMCQPGNILKLDWNARMEEHLGTYRCEILHCYAQPIMHTMLTTYGLSSFCALLLTTLPERYPCPEIYTHATELITLMALDEPWFEHYIRFEFNLLGWLGYGLDLSSCAATGITDDLTYVSPKSGRAVCTSSGLAYHNKLLALPPFLLEGITSHTKTTANLPTLKEIIDGITLTRYFLNKYIYIPLEKKLPMSCDLFTRKLSEHATTDFSSPNVPLNEMSTTYSDGV